MGKGIEKEWLIVYFVIELKYGNGIITGGRASESDPNKTWIVPSGTRCQKGEPSGILRIARSSEVLGSELRVLLR